MPIASSYDSWYSDPYLGIRIVKTIEIEHEILANTHWKEMERLSKSQELHKALAQYYRFFQKENSAPAFTAYQFLSVLPEAPLGYFLLVVEVTEQHSLGVRIRYQVDSTMPESEGKIVLTTFFQEKEASINPPQKIKDFQTVSELTAWIYQAIENESPFH